MRRPGGWWRRKTTPAKVETYTRWSFHFFGVIEVTAIGLTTFEHVGTRLASALSLLVAVHAAVCMVTASRALDWTRGRRAQPVRLLWTLAAVTAVLAVGAVALAGRGPAGEGVDAAAGSVFGGVLCFGAGTVALGVRNRRRIVAIVGGFAAGAGIVGFPLGMPGPVALATAGFVLAGAGFLAFTSVFSVWLLNAVYELDEARETRARLAVAEERLRFARDLHDVMGRNLAVIALKSELAVQLVRRGRPEAVEQMIEVQRIAQESQREVRDVVRGYREADLEAELAGAQGVLAAAGIACEVTGDTSGLPAEVQSALAWVVREATTNVLRHGDAEKCAVVVRMSEGRVVLTVENDGAVDGSGPGPAAGAAGPGGSGLAGLRERLSAVGGTLQAGTAGKGVFRLVADVPLTAGTVPGAAS
ncbi:sensor histidine kinase [Streptomyces sp. TRM S81-3]|uniref:Sensor histidine kinase n=1 Tax=Streptomyces griseicoloratus TaxID=2752516 RepID=A0A926L8D9_9ACTN|nr:histidine kinase [Streptomyces griseicoloratus]MBD0423436.1 sensor histidine kinase [Streptomyces griseicoloratus]